MNDFTFNMDLMKSEAADEEYVIRGIGSCEEIDAVGEVVLQKGMDFEPALKSGWINWDHQAGPENLIGAPTTMEIAEISSHPVMRKSGLRGLGLYVEGKLIKGHPRAEAVWALLNKAGEVGRMLAWSIQGGIVQRSGPQDNILAKSVVRHIAVTHQPIQTRSFAEVAKSFAEFAKSVSVQNMQPLTLENLDGAGYSPASTVQKVLYGRCKDHHFLKSGIFVKGFEGMLEHLTECGGNSITDSKEFLKQYIRSNPRS